MTKISVWLLVHITMVVVNLKESLYFRKKLNLS